MAASVGHRSKRVAREVIEPEEPARVSRHGSGDDDEHLMVSEDRLTEPTAGHATAVLEPLPNLSDMSAGGEMEADGKPAVKRTLKVRLKIRSKMFGAAR